MSNFTKLVGEMLIEEFDTSQCHIKIYYVGFGYKGEDIYCIISKHNTNGKETIRFGNKTQTLGMKRSYYYNNLIQYNDYLGETNYE